MNAMTQPRLTLDAYLAWEEEQPEKHGFHRGEVFAMTGAWRVHGRVQGNISRELGIFLKGSPCQVFSDTMKVQIDDDTVLYPDVFVTCNRADLSTDRIFRSPLLVVEVLSASTQSYDRSHKFSLYRRIPALREYILVDPDTRRVDAFRINERSEWVLHDMSGGLALEMPCMGASVPLGEVFDGIEPPVDAT